jgi:hypothetical protein
MSSHPERRRMTRVATTIEATLHVAGEAPLALELEDLSVIGLRARSGRQVPVGCACRVVLKTGARELAAGGRVVRSRGTELAVGFDQLAFEDYELLRAFLLERAADPGALAAELEDRLGYLGGSGQ